MVSFSVDAELLNKRPGPRTLKGNARLFTLPHSPPLRNATMSDCVDCAHRFGKRAGEEIGIPVYLYGYASDKEYRKTGRKIDTLDHKPLNVHYLAVH